MNIQEIIKIRREELALTYEAIGEIVGVSKSTVRKWEKGMIENMRRDKLVLLAKALQVPTTELLGLELADAHEYADEPETVAAHATDDLTPEEQKKVLEFIKFIKSQRDNND
ncbi:helix-turn-helix domain-containing protein [Fusibacter bizertensis]